MPVKRSLRVVVFGVFDRLHPGHLYLLYHARVLGDELVAILARAATVKSIKGHSPRDSERLRLKNVRDTKLATKVILGDKKLGSYSALKKLCPDIIAIGYDQKELLSDLNKRMRDEEIPKARIVKLKAYKPKRHHSSLLG